MCFEYPPILSYTIAISAGPRRDVVPVSSVALRDELTRDRLQGRRLLRNIGRRVARQTAVIPRPHSRLLHIPMFLAFSAKGIVIYVSCHVPVDG
jgi:hypothetical protein